MVSDSPSSLSGGVVLKECVREHVLVHLYRRGAKGQPFAHSRDRKWLQYGPECGLL